MFNYLCKLADRKFKKAFLKVETIALEITIVESFENASFFSLPRDLFCHAVNFFSLYIIFTTSIISDAPSPRVLREILC